MDRRQIALERAIGLHDDEALFPAVRLLLCGDDIEVMRIYLPDEHRHVLCPSVRGSIRDDRHARGRVALLEFSYHVFLRHFESGEDEFAYRWGFLDMGDVLHREVRPSLRQFATDHPAALRRVLVLLARRLRRSCHICNLKPRMVLQQLDVLLPDHACRAEDSYWNFLHDPTVLTDVCFVKHFECLLGVTLAHYERDGNARSRLRNEFDGDIVLSERGEHLSGDSRNVHTAAHGAHDRLPSFDSDAAELLESLHYLVQVLVAVDSERNAGDRGCNDINAGAIPVEYLEHPSHETVDVEEFG